MIDKENISNLNLKNQKNLKVHKFDFYFLRFLLDAFLKFK